MKLRTITFKAEGSYYVEEQGKEYTKPIEVTGVLDSDGKIVVTEIMLVEEAGK